MRKQETLETIWEVPDELWERVEPIILEEDPPKARGRKRADPRQMLNGIIFRLRSGCQWNRLPKELGDDSTIHRTFQRWVEDGCLAPNVGSPGGGVRRVGWRGLGMAVGRRSDGQGTFWGDLIGPNPDGSWQGWYQAESPCGWRGRPLEHCGCGSKRARCQAVGGDPGRHCGGTTTAH